MPGLPKLIRWKRDWGVSGIGRTRHWLTGVAFADFTLRQEYFPRLFEEINRPNPILKRLAELEIEQRNKNVKITDITES